MPWEISDIDPKENHCPIQRRFLFTSLHLLTSVEPPIRSSILSDFPMVDDKER